MKRFRNLLVSLILFLAGGWVDGGLAAEDRGIGEALESRERPDQSKANEETAFPAGQLPRIRERLVSDEAVLQKIQALKDDPDIQAVLNDSELMETLKTGDLNVVVSNPKFKRLLENPAIQEIMKEVR